MSRYPPPTHLLHLRKAPGLLHRNLEEWIVRLQLPIPRRKIEQNAPKKISHLHERRIKTYLCNSVCNCRWRYLSKPINLTNRRFSLPLQRRPESVAHEDAFVSLKFLNELGATPKKLKNIPTNTNLNIVIHSRHPNPLLLMARWQLAHHRGSWETDPPWSQFLHSWSSRENWKES